MAAILRSPGPRRSVRELLDEHDPVLYVPCVWDGLTALVAEEVGFPAVCTSGFAIAASMGYPDMDIYSKADVVGRTRIIADATSLPMVSDIDTGYGNVVNVTHTVRQFEAAGVSAMFMEDQLAPKRCNYLVSGVPLTPFDEAVAKVRAAVAARRNPETMIIARTDAEGDEIYRRAEAYAEAGADLIMPIAASEEMSKDVLLNLHNKTGVELMHGSVPGSWQDALTREVMAEMGVRIALVGQETLYATIHSLRNVLSSLRDSWRTSSMQQHDFDHLTHEEFAEFIDLAHIKNLEATL